MPWSKQPGRLVTLLPGREENTLSLSHVDRPSEQQAVLRGQPCLPLPEPLKCHLVSLPKCKPFAVLRALHRVPQMRRNHSTERRRLAGI